MTPRIRVVIADDHTLFRDGLAALIETDPDFEVIAHCPDGATAIDTVAVTVPDIAVLDIEMPGPGAHAVISAIKASTPSVAILVLSMHQEPRRIRSLLDAGASGFLAKTVARDQLIAGLRSVLRGSGHIVVSGSRDVLTSVESVLSARELDVLRLVADARTNRQIATELGIAEPTVKRHLTNVYTKLGAVSRVDGVRKAVVLGLIRGV